MFDASGSIASATSAQLVLPEANSRSMLVLQNLSAKSMWFEFGAARATATLSGSSVASFSVTNGGFGYTLPPIVMLFGGGTGGNGRYVGATGPNYPMPSNPAQAHATLSGGVVNAIVLDYAGTGYVTPPLVFLMNNPNDPNGCADPSINSGSGILLASASAPYILNGTACPTDAVAVFCGTTTSLFSCKYMV